MDTWKYIILPLISFLILTVACAANTKNTNQVNTLVLEVNPVFTGEVGYGYVFKCRVNKVIKGSLDDTVIYMTLMINDIKHLNLKSAEDFSGTRVVEFIRDRTGVEMNILPVSGFVDTNRTAWKIARIISR